MKKLKSLLLLVGLTIICLLSLVACGKAELIQPRRLTLSQTTLTLKWTKVDYARMYTVNCVNIETEEEVEYTERSNSCDLSRLKPGEYSIKVKAQGEEDKYRDSDWSKSFSFEREVESGLEYKLINSSTEYELTGMGTASENVVVESVFRGKPVTRISETAFSMNPNIKSIVIGANVRSIGARAFYGCGELTSVTFSTEAQAIALESIEQRAFQSCGKLTSFVIPNGVSEISDYTFSYCSALKEVTIGSGVTKIGDYAFSDCKALASITIPETVQSVGIYAFSNCASLTNAIVGDGVKTLGDYAFYRCVALENLSLGNKLESIGMCAFAGCYKKETNQETNVTKETGLKKVVIPDSVKTISYGAFSSCELLSDVKIGSGLMVLGESTPSETKVDGNHVFANTALWNNAQGVVYAGNWVVGCKDKTAEYIELDANTAGIAAKAFFKCEKVYDIEIPSKVKYVNDMAFLNCVGLMSVTVGNEVLELGDSAFANCTLLEEVTLGEKLQSIGQYAFRNCKVLGSETPVEIPQSVTHIGAYAFHGTTVFAEQVGIVYVGDEYKWAVGVNGNISGNKAIIKDNVVGIADYTFYKSSILSLTMKDSVKYIGRGAFAECTYLGHPDSDGVTLSSSLVAIEDFTFYKCSFLTSVSIPSKVAYIGISAFRECLSLQTVTIPKSVQSIGDFAFFKCQSLKTAGIGDGAKSIGTKAFSDCTSLTSVSMGKGVETIGAYAFYRDSMLEEVVIGENVKKIETYAFSDCSALASVAIPNKVEMIGKYAFRNCASIKTLTLGIGLKTIGESAFFGCEKIKSVVIPASVTLIQKYAFRKCFDLQSVTILSENVEILNHAFYKCEEATLYFATDKVGETWGPRWNSSYRPIVWNCTVSEDGTYVESFVRGATSIENEDALNGMSALRRAGYTFLGWATTKDGEVVYTAQNVYEAPEGTTLYSIWDEGDPVEKDEVIENSKEESENS